MIIVTGGAGFIGSNIVKALNDKGEENIRGRNIPRVYYNVIGSCGWSKR